MFLTSRYVFGVCALAPFIGYWPYCPGNVTLSTALSGVYITHVSESQERSLHAALIPRVGIPLKQARFIARSSGCVLFKNFVIGFKREREAVSHIA